MRIPTTPLFCMISLCFAGVLSGNTQAQLAQCSDQGTWSSEAFSATALVQMSSPLLLTDGRVMAQYVSGLTTGNPWQDWYALTPSKSGCYSHSTSSCASGLTASWSPLASIASVSTTYAPSAFADAVLPDGNVIIEGGEDNFGARAESNGGAYYNSATNNWTNVNPPSGWANIGDAPATVLANGTFMLGNACGNFDGFGQTALLDETTLGWNTMAQPPEWTSEGGFTLLPDNSVVFIPTCWPGQPASETCTTLTDFFNSEAYDPTTDSWTSLGNTTKRLYSYDTTGDIGLNSCFLNQPYFGEQGPAALLPSGIYFATGGYNATHNVVYTSAYNTATKKWTSTPNLPNVTISSKSYPLTAEDQGAVVLRDGNLLLPTLARISSTDSVGPYFLEWNGSSYCEINNLPSGMPGQSELMTLPTGQILVMGVSWGSPANYFIYTPGGTTYAGIAPTITTFPATLVLGSTYTITGTQFNGATQSSFFGDDFQNATNYPLVRIKNNGTKHVIYAKSHNPSTMGVATGAASVSTMFDVPATTELGTSTLYVVANGIPSKAVTVTVTK